MVKLNDGERIDQLFREQRSIIQSKQYFAFSVDAVLLADFVQLPKRAFRYLDFCCGNGIIPLLLSAKTDNYLEGIEIQAELVEMANRSLELNGLTEQINIFQGDINDLTKPSVLYDIITCNPPYFLVENSKELHQLGSHQIARHEVALSMSEWVKKASVLLREKGRLFIVHRPERLDDLTESLLKHQFSIKRLKFVYPKEHEQANIVLIEAIYRGGRRGVRVEPPLIIHTVDNDYTQAMKEIYFGSE